MEAQSYWSVEQCRWVHPAGDHYWSVQRCRWEPAGPAADALATPWSGWTAPEPQLPQQREPQPAPAPVEG